MRFISYVCPVIPFLCICNSAYADAVSVHSQDADFRVAAIKVGLFLTLAFVLSVLIKRKKLHSGILFQDTAQDIRVLSHKIIRDSSTIALVKVDNKKILITTNRNGGVAMLSLDDAAEADVLDASEHKIREVSNG